MPVATDLHAAQRRARCALRNSTCAEFVDTAMTGRHAVQLMPGEDALMPKRPPLNITTAARRPVLVPVPAHDLKGRPWNRPRGSGMAANEADVAAGLRR